MTTEEQIRKEIESIDWDAIRDQNRMEAIGSELYGLAREIEDMGYEKTVATVAALMDGFKSHWLPRLGDDSNHIANGFAHALMRDVVATLEKEGDTE